jgi:hypothetical protein
MAEHDKNTCKAKGEPLFNKLSTGGHMEDYLSNPVVHYGTNWRYVSNSQSFEKEKGGR